MNHIDEGLIILSRLGATDSAQKAFCLHPLLQNDEDLKDNFKYVAKNTDIETLALAMEYRNIANNWLSDKVFLKDGNPTHDIEIKLSPLHEVNDMLRADKLQNYKDFLLYHKNNHKRSTELDYYFNKWIAKLFETNDIDSLNKKLLSYTE